MQEVTTHSPGSGPANAASTVRTAAPVLGVSWLHWDADILQDRHSIAAHYEPHS